MKKFLYTIIAALFSFFIISGCTEEVKDQLLPEKMSATINDTSWRADLRKTTRESDRFIINGTSVDGQILNITIHGTTEKKYDLNTNTLDTTSSVDFNAFFKRSAKISNDDIFYASKGTVELTEVNTNEETISGTFAFTMYKADSEQAFIKEDSVVVTNGKFTELRY